MFNAPVCRCGETQGGLCDKGTSDTPENYRVLGCRRVESAAISTTAWKCVSLDGSLVGTLQVQDSKV